MLSALMFCVFVLFVYLYILTRKRKRYQSISMHLSKEPSLSSTTASSIESSRAKSNNFCSLPHHPSNTHFQPPWAKDRLVNWKKVLEPQGYNGITRRQHLRPRKLERRCVADIPRSELKRQTWLALSAAAAPHTVSNKTASAESQPASINTTRSFSNSIPSAAQQQKELDPCRSPSPMSTALPPLFELDQWNVKVFHAGVMRLHRLTTYSLYRMIR